MTAAHVVLVAAAHAGCGRLVIAAAAGAPRLLLLVPPPHLQHQHARLHQRVIMQIGARREDEQIRQQLVNSHLLHCRRRCACTCAAAAIALAAGRRCCQLLQHVCNGGFERVHARGARVRRCLSLLLLLLLAGLLLQPARRVLHTSCVKLRLQRCLQLLLQAAVAPGACQQRQEPACCLTSTAACAVAVTPPPAPAAAAQPSLQAPCRENPA